MTPRGTRAKAGGHMRHVVIDHTRTICVEEAPDPRLPGPGGAIVEIEAATICGSDLHFYDGDIPVSEPLSLGHECIGRVIELGPEVRSVAVGHRVLVSSIAGCGSCVGCDTLNPAACIHGPQVFGSGVLGGCQATHVAVPAADFQLLEIPEGVTDEAALLLTDNLATGWAGAERADITPGDTVVVLGLGAVGLCAVRSALALGAGTVIGIDPVAGRRDRAVASGALCPAGPTVESVLELTDGRGAHSVIDAVALDITLDDAFAAVRVGGTISVIGVHDLSPYPMPMLMSLFRSLTLRTTIAPIQQTWPALIPRIVDGTLATDGIITHHVDLSDAERAYGLAADRSGECLKVMLIPEL